jgi:hypothetical protein
VLASIGTVGDTYDNATAESFVDSFKAVIHDRVWRTRTQLELAVVEYLAGFKEREPIKRTSAKPGRAQ